MESSPIHVIKLGGSLLDMPDLRQRFERFATSYSQDRLLLLVGGGRTADLVRDLDTIHGLGEESSHWLALRAMQINAHIVAAMLPNLCVVTDIDGCHAAWCANDLVLVDPLRWLQIEHDAGITIAHQWSFTSDSIAAHLAHRLMAERLTLLKSKVPDSPCRVACAVELGLVDRAFETASRGLTHVQLVDLRNDPLRRCVMR